MNCWILSTFWAINLYRIKVEIKYKILERTAHIKMNIQALYHEPKSSYAYAYRENELHLRFRSAKDDLDGVSVIYGNKFAWSRTRNKMSMQKIQSDEYFDYYQCSIVNADTRHAYYFELKKENDLLYYTEIGIREAFDETEDEHSFFTYPNICVGDVLITPEWMRDAVFYQIYVDSFCKGDPFKNSVNQIGWEEEPHWRRCLGGDLKGITQKLPYLKELGINAIYLTPIFLSDSSHKYNTFDYMKIDECFGNEDDLKDLVETAHSFGIKIVLDAVFNHCGVKFEPFEDVIEKGQQSEYWNWFFIEGEKVQLDPPNYKAFSFTGKMPKLNTANPKTREYLLNVASYWIINFQIDGWRLDVADEVEHDFWQAFRKTVKKSNPEACIIGESWHNAAAWLKGDQFDSVMHYPLTKLVLEHFAKSSINAETFTNQLGNWLMKYPGQASEVTLNFLDSHDVSRFLTSAKEELWRLKNAAAFLFAYIGIPCTYYGTEIGMKGGNNLECRRGFLWNEQRWNKELFQYYQLLIRLRSEEMVLRRGTVTFCTKNEIFIMKRKYKEDQIIIFINNQPVEVEISFEDFMDTASEVGIKTVLLQSEHGDILQYNKVVIPSRCAVFIKGQLLSMLYY